MPDLVVDADLRLQVTTAAGGTTTARVSGSGQRVLVETEHPDVLLSAVDRADVGRVADLLAASGVTVSVVGPHGPVATLGAGTSSRLGRTVTGSSAVAPNPAAAARLVWTQPAVRIAGLLVPVALAVLALFRLRRGQRR